MSIPLPTAKSVELGDVTNKGRDPVGLVAAVCMATACGSMAGTLMADRINSPTVKARMLVAGATGAVTGAYVAGGASNRNSIVVMTGLALGSAAAVFGARLLGKIPKEKSSSSSKARRTNTMQAPAPVAAAPAPAAAPATAGAAAPAAAAAVAATAAAATTTTSAEATANDGAKAT